MQKSVFYALNKNVIIEVICIEQARILVEE